MPRIAQLTHDTADAAQAELLDETKRQLGKVPNLYASLANSPAALRGYLALRDSLAAGVLTERQREQLALLIAQENRCDYCVAAHTMRGHRLLGMREEELFDTRRGRDEDPHSDAILRVASGVVRSGGRVEDTLLAEAREAGVTDAELAEIVAHIALNTLSNYFNHLARPTLDFPSAPPLPATASPDITEATTKEPTLNWRTAETIELVAGYTITDADGQAVAALSGADIASEGGFLHIAVPGSTIVQIVSAPALRRVTYRAGR